jgi:CzcA family heavy metal efflux pump
MLSGLIDLALKQRLIVFIGALALAVWGALAYQKLSIDAFPDVAPIQVLVSMQAPGLAPEELESRVTTPIELAARGIPNLVRMRSTTRYAVALLTFEFADGTDIFWARAQVNERLQEVRDQLPAGASGGLAPIVTPLAEMVMFTIDSPNLSAQEKRSLLDWTIRPALRSLPGVADVNMLGGYVRTFEVIPSASAMAARGITTQMLEKALEVNNRNDGAGRIRSGEEALLVRSEGRIQTLDDIRNTVVATRNGVIVRVSDIADVRFGSLARNGVVSADAAGEAVWGIVLGLRGANARTVVDGVKARFDQLTPQLPDGARIVIFYDRSELIGKAVWTVQKVLLEAIVFVIILLLLFLGNLRSALVVSLILPLAVLTTFGVMRMLGWSANIMSLGGLAIAIGLLVDCAVVVVENVEHRLSTVEKPDMAARLRLSLEATREVAVPLLSGVAIIILVFMPLLALQGLEGRLFSPVALTIVVALVAALILSLTVVPALSAYLPAGRCARRAVARAQAPCRLRPAACLRDAAAGRRVRRGGDRHRGSRRRLPADRQHLHAGDGRRHARDHDPQASDHLDRRSSAVGSAHPADAEGGDPRDQTDHLAGRCRRTRHRPGRPQRDRHVHDAGPAPGVARPRHGLVPRRTSPRARWHSGHQLRTDPADRHAGAGDDHRRARRRGRQGIRRRHREPEPGGARRRCGHQDGAGSDRRFRASKRRHALLHGGGRSRGSRPVRPQRRGSPGSVAGLG